MLEAGPATKFRYPFALERFAILFTLCWVVTLSGCSLGGGGSSSGSSGNSGGSSSSNPILTAAVAAQGNFSSGEQNATYTITVSNTGTAATSGTVTLTGSPTGFTITSMSGTNWQCSASTATCTSTLAIAPGEAFPPIIVTGNVGTSVGNGTTLTIPVSLSGGGLTSTASSSATINVAAPVMTITKSHSGNFIQGQQDAVYTVTVKDSSTAGATSGKAEVMETLPSGETLVAMSGAGWTCPGAGGANTCDRSDPLLSGASYPAIAVIVNVATNAASPQTNQVSVSGGGMTGSASTTDQTTVVPPAAGADLAIVTTHGATQADLGNFGAGLQGVFMLAVSNVGSASTTGTITVADTLPSQLTFVSATATGWTCNSSGQSVTCTNPGPVAPGTSAATIPLVVNVSTSAPGSISDTATVADSGDTDTADKSSTDTVDVIASAATVLGDVPGPVIYASGNSETVSVTVSNDQASDTLTPVLTLSGGGACTAATCGTLGSVTGTPGSGSYTISYTPPASVTAPTSITLTISSSLANSFPCTSPFAVNPAGTRIVGISGTGAIGPRVLPGSQTRQGMTVTVYNDPGSPGPGAAIELLAAGYACPAAGSGTICGTLSVGSTTSGTTTTGTTGIPFTATGFTYTPPASIPNPPYDRPMILAVSNADNSALAQSNFQITTMGTTNLVIGENSRLNTALTGAAPITIGASLGSDSGVNKTVNWTLTAGGADCQPECGSLGTAAYTWNGANVSASIPYTPPEAVPSGAASSPTITATSVDVINGAQQTDSFTFQIADGTCGSGNNGVLNGQYAFLLQGGAVGLGYEAYIGSFSADGNGNITGGSWDINRTTGSMTGLSVLSTGSSYSVGSDGRGCLVLASSNGAGATFRIAVGTLSSGVATKGQMIRFDDFTGTGQRMQGILIKQDPTSFVNSALNGQYVFGQQGIDATGGRIVTSGVATANGSGSLSNFDRDVNDNGELDQNDASGSGTYSIDTTGRGTATFVDGSVTNNSVIYMVSSSEFLSMSTDALGPNTPILSGDNRQQSVPSGGFTQNSLNGNAYVFSATAVDPSNGGNATLVGQIQFSTGGADTGVQYVNDNGTLSSAEPISDMLTIAANGRATNSDGSLVFYFAGTNSGFILATNVAALGYGQQQTGGPFTAASLSGQYFFGGGAPTIGASFFSGTATANGAGALAGDLDVQTPLGLGSTSFSYSYSVTSSTTGQLMLTTTNPNFSGGLGFVVSSSYIIFISTGTDPAAPDLTIGQQ